MAHEIISTLSESYSTPIPHSVVTISVLIGFCDLSDIRTIWWSFSHGTVFIAFLDHHWTRTKYSESQNPTNTSDSHSTVFTKSDKACIQVSVKAVFYMTTWGSNKFCLNYFLLNLLKDQECGYGHKVHFSVRS